MKRWFDREQKTETGFSIICAYNSREKLEKYLVKSLSNQTAPFELLTIDNTKEDYISAPHILNKTAGKARFEFLMFVHQDVALGSETWLENALKDMESLPNLGAAGVAGKSEKGFAASVTHGNPPFFTGDEKLTAPVEVQTLDGCLMIVPTKIFRKFSFDEKTIDGWYLYIADYCLELARRGYKNYVLPQQIYHESTGPKDPHLYEKTLLKILQKHWPHTKMIYTTMGEWSMPEPDKSL
jgi:hypothetical protein